MTETDEQFVERMRGYLRANLEADDAARLEALARRGADAADEIERLRAALERIADTDPDEGTQWFHEVARAALQQEPQS